MINLVIASWIVPEAWVPAVTQAMLDGLIQQAFAFAPSDDETRSVQMDVVFFLTRETEDGLERLLPPGSFTAIKTKIYELTDDNWGAETRDALIDWYGGTITVKVEPPSKPKPRKITIKKR